MFEELLKKVSKELTRNKIPYIVIGGQAVLLYGYPRVTKDIDITVGVGADRINDIKKVIAKSGLKYLVKDIENFVRQTMVLPVIQKKSGIRIDFVFSSTKYEKKAMERANSVRLRGVAVNFASLEDLIIHKIIAKREKDLDDVRMIIIKNPGYDKKYILFWLKQFDAVLSEDLILLFKRIINLSVRG